MQLTHGSFFSGIGTFEFAAENNGIKNLFVVEIDEQKREHLKRKFPETTIYEDVRLINENRSVDIISFGFPCQDISRAKPGAKGITGEQSKLWKEPFRYIREQRPKIVLIENSPDLLNRGFEKILYEFSEIGYYAEWNCLQARHFGALHKRERVFIAAYPGEIGSETDKIFFDFHGEAQNKKREKRMAVSDQSDISIEKSVNRVKEVFTDICADDGLSGDMDKIAWYGDAIYYPIADYLIKRSIEFLTNNPKG